MSRSRRLALLACCAVALSTLTKANDVLPADDLKKLVSDLGAAHGAAEEPRIARGIRQAATLWRREDGDAAAFAAFAKEQFQPTGERLDATFEHLEHVFEQIDGHLNEVARETRWWNETDTGPLLPVDRLLATLDPYAHVLDDLFQNKTAFVTLLNFPLTTLEERLEKGPSWSRRQWAEARLAGRFSKRVPAQVSQAITKASADGDAYIAEYNVWMHHVLDEDGKRLFPAGLRLISHWNLRDDLKARYAEPDGLAKQRLMARVMERIVTQTIPACVIDNPRADWMPVSNGVRPAPAEEVEKDAPPKPGPLGDQREPDTRYEHLLKTFLAAKLADPYSPAAPTLIARRFDEMREIPEKRVVKMLEDVLTSPLIGRVAAVIEKRLGRKLEPFDVWYNGFVERARHRESDLDALVSKRYPDAASFQADIPRILGGLGFTKERAAYLAERIVVDPSRGAGHAMPAARRGDKPRLRTRVEKAGMNYKGFNIAVHELGHNVEQVFSLYGVDHTLLAGVPNNAFTEALAFVFQARDLELLGLAKPDAESERLRVLNELWMTYEICGPALVDIQAWHWMYDHPGATRAELRDAVVGIAKEAWNRYYAPVFGVRDSVLLAVYSHMVSLYMYLPDYPIGHMIAFQIEELLRGKELGKEFERIASFGSVAPDLWMEHATGSPVSADALLRAAERAVQ